MNNGIKDIINTFFLWIVIALVAIFRILKARRKNKRSR